MRERGLSLSAFKKGPDYIDPAWIALVGGTVCRNLDTYMVDRAGVLRNFVVHAEGTDMAVVEGNRGVYDGRDVEGTHSTAELAKLIHAPVILIVNAAKSTRTVAAIIKGCVDFDPDVSFGGVILNRVAGERHRKILTRSIEKYCGLPVLGAIPNLKGESPLIPGRHLGLVTPSEFKGEAELSSRLLNIAKEHLDLDRLVSVARSAGPVECTADESPVRAAGGVKIGYFEDSVFTFYYPENLDALEAEGAKLIPISSLSYSRLPNIDALYIGGGFPETHAEQLTRNESMMSSVRTAGLAGLPIYAECGGLIYLTRSLRWGDNVYPMAGLFPIDLEMHAKPVGHGYTRARVDRPNPFYKVGTEIRGHEFHYTGVAGDLSGVDSCMKMEAGTGLGGGRDALVVKNTMACYTHVHADGVKGWARAIIDRAGDYAETRRNRVTDNDSEEGWIKSEAV